MKKEMPGISFSVMISKVETVAYGYCYHLVP